MTDSPSNVLIVDDDRETCVLVKAYLERHGFAVTTAGSGAEMKRLQRRTEFDLVLLDVMLPGESGLEICRRLRSESAVPIIMLTAINELTDRVVGLELGADDYIAKPFEPRELLARARAVIRRKGGAHPPSPGPKSEIYRFEGWVLDVGRRRLTNADEVVVSLTYAEFELLTALVRNANRPLSRAQIMELTSGSASEAYDRSVDVLVSRLRRKLTGPSGMIEITGVRGVGYVLNGVVERP